MGRINQFLAAAGTNPSNPNKFVLGNAYRSLDELCGVLGINARETVPRGDNAVLIEQLMELILDVRQEARSRKDWEVSDKIRDGLKQLNIELKDSQLGNYLATQR